VVLGAGVEAAQARVHEELVGVQRAGRLQGAGPAVPYRDVGEQLADLRPGGVPVGAVAAVLEPDPRRLRRDGVALVEADQLAAHRHLAARVAAERQVAPVDEEAAGDRAGLGDDGRGGPPRPQARAEQRAARRGADRAAHDGAAADHVAAQVRRPLLMLLGERPVPPRPGGRRHSRSVGAPGRPREMRP
jgi:hypothetical protein